MQKPQKPAPIPQIVHLDVVCGQSGSRPVLLGIAPARILFALSYADVFDEDIGVGYQRPFSQRHSLDFRKYIERDGATTPPLTFNLRPATAGAWSIAKRKGDFAHLKLRTDAGRVLSQVDCQHRLGYVSDLETSLPFMIFLGLEPSEEMEVFSIINSKAKGLSSSLLDYHASRLARDLSREKPELFMALHLNEAAESPWKGLLDLGGTTTTGLRRKASLRTMQKAIKRFLAASQILNTEEAEDVAGLILDFWVTVAAILPQQWAEPRRHLLTKGVGVYALMGLLADVWAELPSKGASNRGGLADALAFLADVNWSNEGPLKGLGGESGAREALLLLRRAKPSPALT